MHHIKFEKNWSSGYQEEVKNVKMPRPGGKTSTPTIIKFTILEASLHHHAFSFSYIHVVSEKKIFFQKLVNFDTFCPAPWAPGGRKPEIHNLCPLCPKNTSYQI
jgi:hypothetical protein